MLNSCATPSFARLQASLGRGELTATFDGPAARALGELTRATAANDTPGVVAAAERARHFGIVINDPRAGVGQLTDAIRELITGAQHELVIVTKRMQSDTYKNLLDEARARGVKVIVQNPSKNHANIIIQDGTAAWFGTAHFSGRSLNVDRTTGRRSREIGLLVRDSAVAQQIRDGAAAIGAHPSGSSRAALRSALAIGAIPAGLVALFGAVMAAHMLRSDPDKP